MTKVECLCIDDKKRPNEVLPQNWIMEGIEYHIVHVYHYRHQEGGIKGVLLEEVSTKSIIYDSYRLTRFAFTKEGIDKLVELMLQCTELNKVDINKLIEESNLKTIEKV